MADETPFLVVGGSSRIGQVLRSQTAALERAGLSPIWQSRQQSTPDLFWDVLAEPCPKDAASGVVMCLAGVINGGVEALALNTDLALATCRAAADQGARHVFLASSAAIYGASDAPIPETAEPKPARPYGVAKASMERAVLDWQFAGGPGVTILRIGNIAGLDMLLGNLSPGKSMQLDRVSGQQGGPVRSYIGPVTLARVLAQLAGLAAEGKPLPRVLNIAAGPAVSMASLLDAAGAEWGFRDPTGDVIARVELDTRLLRDLVKIPHTAWQAGAMVAEWRELKK
jgi:nucleoside-diphosphate-sugar epimerase